MDIKGLFKDSLTYPTKEWDKLLILGVIFIIMGIFTILQVFGITLYGYVAIDVLFVISSILTLVMIVIIAGYTLSITRKTINNVGGNVPEFDWVNNIVDGIKVLVLTIVYYIIPAVITLTIAYLTGALHYIYQFIGTYVTFGSLESIHASVASSTAISFLIVLIVAAIFYIIFSLLFLIAKAVLAETESLGAAVNMIYVFNKIGEIKWGNYVIWLIIFVFISLIISWVSGIISIIPFIGIIIVSLIINPYVEMFSARSLGLIYNESKE